MVGWIFFALSQMREMSTNVVRDYREGELYWASSVPEGPEELYSSWRPDLSSIDRKIRKRVLQSQKIQITLGGMRAAICLKSVSYWDKRERKRSDKIN